MQPLFSYKFSVNPLFLQNTRGKFLKYFFEEQDTALLLLGIRFILLFCFTCQFFLGMTPVRVRWAATWCPTLEAWCNVVAYAGSLVQRGGHMHGDSSFRTFFDITRYNLKIL